MTDSLDKRFKTGNLKDWRSMSGLEGLETAFQFLQNTDLAALPLGRNPIDGDRLFAAVMRISSLAPESNRFEAHSTYIDVQYLISGEEMIGVRPASELTIMEPYSEDNDIAFYSVPDDYARVEMRPGRFTVLYPGEGHMPNCHLTAPAELHKVVVKVHMDCLN